MFLKLFISKIGSLIIVKSAEKPESFSFDL